jgi:hypothetical protein
MRWGQVYYISLFITNYQKSVSANLLTKRAMPGVRTEDRAVQIYRCKFQSAIASHEHTADSHLQSGRSAAVAREFAISPKTVRDIWNHVTWKSATYPFWPTATAQYRTPASESFGSPREYFDGDEKVSKYVPWTHHLHQFWNHFCSTLSKNKK